MTNVPHQENNPAPQKSNRFSKNPVLAFSIITILFVLLLELLSQGALFIKDRIKTETSDPLENYLTELQKADSIDPVIFKKEMEDLYIKGIEYHPYRWYSLPGGYSGKYFQTDSLGYRILPTEVNDSKHLLACFGGSTMFSIRTDQTGTLPGCLNALNLLPDSVQALNFGIGAYASTCELNSFIEVSRAYPIKTALFFDGVNEVTRYLERFMYIPDKPVYDYVGYPYQSAIEQAFQNTLNKTATEFEMKKKTVWRPALYWVSVSILNKIRNLFPAPSKEALNAETSGWTESDYDAAGKKAAYIYLQNIRDIDALAKSKGIKAVFILQPTLFSSQAKLTEEELSFKENNHPFVKAIHEATYRYILDADKTGIEFIDLSSGFDDLPDEPHFYDWHHVNRKGNEHLAKKIAVSLKEKFFK